MRINPCSTQIMNLNSNYDDEIVINSTPCQAKLLYMRLIGLNAYSFHIKCAINNILDLNYKLLE